jgi:hypothetical protein
MKNHHENPEKLKKIFHLISSFNRLYECLFETPATQQFRKHQVSILKLYLAKVWFTVLALDQIGTIFKGENRTLLSIIPTKIRPMSNLFLITSMGFKYGRQVFLETHTEIIIYTLYRTMFIKLLCYKIHTSQTQKRIVY